jgi:hypothetical protein
MRVQMASDNRRYASVGLPAVAVVMDMPGCKTPAETPDRVAPGTQAGRLVVQTVERLTDVRGGAPGIPDGAGSHDAMTGRRGVRGGHGLPAGSPGA